MHAIAWHSALDHLPPVGAPVWLLWPARPPVAGALVTDPRRKRRPRPGEVRRYVDGRLVCWAVNVAGGRLRGSGVASDHERADHERLLLPADAAPSDPRAPWVGWHTLAAWPDFWRPADAARWAAPLPPVAWIDDGVEQPGRLWSATMSYRAVEDAEEQHGSATAPGGRLPSGQSPGANERQWWRDPFAVTYSPPGSISRREAEGRLMRAFNAEHWVRIERPDMGTFAEALARSAKRTMPSAADLAADDAPMPMRPEPTGRDRDDMLTALGWLKALGAGDSPAGSRPPAPWPSRGEMAIASSLGGAPALRASGTGASGRLAERESLAPTKNQPHEQILRLRERDPPLSWRQIGKRVGVSHERARQLYGEALDIITATANGEITAGAADIAERLAAMQASNRAWRRGERD